MNQPAATQVCCPTCGKTVAWTAANPYRPFCSKRCKGIDLGAWANEDYRIAAAEEDSGTPAQAGD
jgi:hypothetical protein